MQITNPLLSGYITPTNSGNRGNSTPAVSNDDNEDQGARNRLPSLIEQSQLAATQTYLPAQKRVNPLSQTSSEEALALLKKNQSSEPLSPQGYADNVAPQNRQAIGEYQQSLRAAERPEGLVILDIFV